VIVDRWMGIPFERPLTRVKETLHVVKSALAGEKVKFEGSTLRTGGFKLEQAPEPPVPVFLAALGPKMMALAAAEADGLALFLAAEPGVKIAAEAAPGTEIVGRILCCPDEPIEDVRQMARWQITPYIAVPAYNRFIAAQGFEAEAKAVATSWAAGDRAAALEAVTDELVDALVITGPAEACKERLDAFREAGMSTPILMLFSGAGAEGTLKAVERMAPSR
jgi:alkanesulfonate monooxygenase SsuD/methylene tetrahydromethanopterin reductase-like flavin-dependent oxidoreductase (luciferase family)